jgi:signal transduction histidine kinase
MKARFSAVLEERHRMSREIHDTVAQGLTGTSIHLESVAEMIYLAPEVANEHLSRARQLVRSSLAEARRLVWDLRPRILEGENLGTALTSMARELEKGTRIRVQVRGAVRPLPQPVESHLLRIGQEALTNAIKHAQAGQIRVDLRFAEECVRLRIKDNGRGFDTQAAAEADGGHLGLISLRERAAHIGARLTINSRPGGGTRVIAVLPLRPTGLSDRSFLLGLGLGKSCAKPESFLEPTPRNLNEESS